MKDNFLFCGFMNFFPEEGALKGKDEGWKS